MSSSSSQRLTRATLASAITLALTACGGSTEMLNAVNAGAANQSSGGSSTSTSTTTTNPKANLAGTVADGYLVGAKVCLDLNRDKACGSDEPSATTGTGGAYTLDVPAGIDSAQYPIVVEVSESTIDEDDGKPVGKPYVLSAPPGKPEFVSPLTTMIHSTLEQNPNLTVEEAETQLKTNLGVTGTVSLFKDYVKEKHHGDTANEYKRIHTIAQVVANALEDNISEVKSAAQGAGLDPQKVFDKLVNLVVNKVIERLGSITQAVDERPVGEVAPPKVTISVDRDDVKKDIEELDRAAKIAAAAMRDILEGGINSYDAWTDCRPTSNGPACAWTIEHHRTGLAKDGAHLEQTSQHFDIASRTWTDMQLREDDEGGFALTPKGWISLAGDEAATINFNDDHTATVTLGQGSDVIKVKGAVLDIGGQALRAFLPTGKPEWFAEGQFSKGAKVYKWTFTQLHDLYEIHAWGEGETCGNGQSAESLGGNCNTVAGGSSVESKAPAAELKGVIYATAPTWSRELPALHLGERLRAVLIGDPNDLGKGGVVRFKEYAPVAPPGAFADEANINKEVRWELKTVHGQQIIEFPVPAYLRELASHLDGAPNAILAVHAGWVRLGAHTPKGFVHSEPSWNYNDVASEDLQAQFDAGADFFFEQRTPNPNQGGTPGEGQQPNGNSGTTGSNGDA